MQWMTPQERQESQEMMVRFRAQQRRSEKWMWEDLSKEYGKQMTCQADIMEEIDRQDTQCRTCKTCGMISSTYDKMATHIGSEKCRKRVAEKLKIEYVPLGKMPKYCVLCKKSVQTQSWKRHLQSNEHRQIKTGKSKLFLYCPLCDKDFTERSRPKRCFKNHILKNKQHKRLSKLNGGVTQELLLAKIHNTQVV